MRENLCSPLDPGESLAQSSSPIRSLAPLNLESTQNLGLSFDLNTGVYTIYSIFHLIKTILNRNRILSESDVISIFSSSEKKTFKRRAVNLIYLKPEGDVDLHLCSRVSASLLAVKTKRTLLRSARLGELSIHLLTDYLGMQA